MVAKGPYITADKLQDPVGNFVATAKSMGPVSSVVFCSVLVPSACA